MTIFEFGEFFLDALFLFLAKCLRYGKPPPEERRRNNVRAQQRNDPDLSLRRVCDPQTNWSYISSINWPGPGNFGVHDGDWLKSDIRSRVLHNGLVNKIDDFEHE